MSTADKTSDTRRRQSSSTDPCSTAVAVMSSASPGGTCNGSASINGEMGTIEATRSTSKMPFPSTMACLRSSIIPHAAEAGVASRPKVQTARSSSRSSNANKVMLRALNPLQVFSIKSQHPGKAQGRLGVRTMPSSGLHEDDDSENASPDSRGWRTLPSSVTHQCTTLVAHSHLHALRGLLLRWSAVWLLGWLSWLACQCGLLQPRHLTTSRIVARAGTMPDHHSVLGVSHSASPEVWPPRLPQSWRPCAVWTALVFVLAVQAIKKAYKEMAKKWHPDLHGAVSEAGKRHAADKFKVGVLCPALIRPNNLFSAPHCAALSLHAPPCTSLALDSAGRTVLRSPVACVQMIQEAYDALKHGAPLSHRPSCNEGM